jgi:Transposase zinc-binding domain/Putative transposase
MGRPCLEVADVFRAHGAAWRKATAGHVSLAQLKVMSAIETCRTAALGGHVERCEDCAHERVAYNSCRNRHCPKCQGAAARQWLAERDAELLPAPYYHVVFTLPAAIGVIAFQNKAAVYDLLFKAAAETLTTIAADPKHLGARVGLTAVLHTWGSALTYHPHVHVIVPGGGLSPDGSRWIACKPGFFLPVRVLSRLFRRLFLEGLPRSTQPAAWPCSAISRPLPTSAPSTPRSRRCAAPHGWSTPRGRSPGRRPSSPTSRATSTASPSPTPG